MSYFNENRKQIYLDPKMKKNAINPNLEEITHCRLDVLNMQICVFIDTKSIFIEKHNAFHGLYTIYYCLQRNVSFV